MSEKASSAQTSCQTARSEVGLLRCFSQKSVTDDSQRNVEAAQKTKTIEKVCNQTINVQEKQQRSYHNGYDTSRQFLLEVGVHREKDCLQLLTH